MTKTIAISVLLASAALLGACAPAPAPAPVEAEASTGKL
jgi:hypothetical protein